jgi:hypothetical protein
MIGNLGEKKCRRHGAFSMKLGRTLEIALIYIEGKKCTLVPKSAGLAMDNWSRKDLKE